jgi:hypothetical protein
MRILLVAAFLLSGFQSSAQNRPVFTLQDNRTGEMFNCGVGGANPPTTNPNCVNETSNYCNSYTSYSRNDCFTKSSNACKGAGANFPQCVSSSANYCNSNTSLSRNACFDNALNSCSGQFPAMQLLIEEVSNHRQFLNSK